MTVSDEELQAAKNTFLVNHSEALQSGALVTETLAGNAMSGVESASEMINMISTSDINVSLEKFNHTGSFISGCMKTNAY